MKTVQVTRPGVMNLIDKEIPDIQKDNEVRIRVKIVGICGSDMHIYNGSNPFAVYPRVIGHEVAGEIDAVGKNVSRFNRGDKVVIEPIHTCGKCYACRIGRRNVCEKLEVYGVHRDGGLQEYWVLPEYNVHKVNQELSWSEAVLVEPFTIGAQANWRGVTRSGDVVFIIGAGPTGLCCLKMAKIQGATCIVSDLNDKRLRFAQKWGADYTVNAKLNVEEQIFRITDGMGANVVIDAVGISKTFEDAIKVASNAGRIVTLGFGQQLSQISQLEITKKELTIAGSRLQTGKFTEVIQLFHERKIHPGDMISHQLSLDEYQKAINLIENNPDNLRKVVLKV